MLLTNQKNNEVYNRWCELISSWLSAWLIKKYLGEKEKILITIAALSNISFPTLS
jgi:hypothetical protein